MHRGVNQVDLHDLLMGHDPQGSFDLGKAVSQARNTNCQTDFDHDCAVLFKTQADNRQLAKSRNGSSCLLSLTRFHELRLKVTRQAVGWGTGLCQNGMKWTVLCNSTDI